MIKNIVYIKSLRGLGVLANHSVSVTAGGIPQNSVLLSKGDTWGSIKILDKSDCVAVEIVSDKYARFMLDGAPTHIDATALIALIKTTPISFAVGKQDAAPALSKDSALSASYVDVLCASIEKLNEKAVSSFTLNGKKYEFVATKHDLNIGICVVQDPLSPFALVYNGTHSNNSHVSFVKEDNLIREFTIDNDATGPTVIFKSGLSASKMPVVKIIEDFELFQNKLKSDIEYITKNREFVLYEDVVHIHISGQLYCYFDKLIGALMFRNIPLGQSALFHKPQCTTPLEYFVTSSSVKTSVTMLLVAYRDYFIERGEGITFATTAFSNDSKKQPRREITFAGPEPEEQTNPNNAKLDIKELQATREHLQQALNFVNRQILTICGLQ